MKSHLCILLVWLAGAATSFGQTVYSQNIIPIGSVYRYLDNGTDQGTAWHEPHFNDLGWAAGPAPLGYGQSDLNTIVSYGPNAADKYRTTYFRHAFVTPMNPVPTNLLVRLRRDDGGIVYLNGVEIFRSNMPTGAVTHLALASTAVSGTDETNYFVSPVLTAALLLPPPQTNVLAAEIHQASPASSDLAFCVNLGGDAELPASLTLAVPAGYSTFANNFVRGGNTLKELLLNPADQTQIFKWIPASQSYLPSTYDAFLGEWSTNFTLNTGEGAWIYSPVAQFLTQTGQVAVVGYVNRPTTGGLRLVGGRVPVASTFEEITGYLPREGDRVLLYDGSYVSIPSQPSSTHVLSNGVWSPSLPLLPVGKGAFLDPMPFSSLLTCFSNKTVDCTNFLNLETLFDPPTLISGCCSNVVLTNFTLTNFAACATYYTRIWQATDCCTNSSCSQTITVVDTTPPVFSYCPTNKVVACGTDWDFDQPAAFDTCCVSNPVINILSTTGTFISNCQSNYTRLWQATDCCGNTNTCSQTVSVIKTPPPALQTFSNPGYITIRDANTAVPYPAPITVSGLSGPLSKLTVQLNKFLHHFPSDVDIMLVAPTGQSVMLMSDAGGSSPVEDLILVFDDSAPGVVPESAAIVSGTYRPSNHGAVADGFPPPAPATPTATSLSAFIGSDPNGTWNLYVIDNSVHDLGSISNGWSLTIYTGGPTLACATNKTVECGTAWNFDPPSLTGTCCGTNYTVLVLNTETNGTCPQSLTRTWRVIDCCTNLAECSQTVTVVDNTPPLPICSNLTFTCTQPGGRVVEFPLSATDNCDPYPFVTSSPLSGSFFPVGLTVVTNFATDACGNSNLCLFTVTVLDNCPTNCVFISCPGTNLVAYACETNGAYVPYLVSATNICNPRNFYVVCDPPPNSWFPLGNTTVDCWVYELIGGQSNHCSFTVTVVSNCPPECLVLTCPDDITMPCASLLGTPVDWNVEAVNHCNPGHVVSWSEPAPNFSFQPGVHTVICYASNTLSGEVISCSFTVNLFIPAPIVSIRRGGGSFGIPDQLIIGWAERCDTFGPQWAPGVGAGGAGPAWSPYGDTTFAHWSRVNPTNNAINLFVQSDIPFPVGDPAPDMSFFRLTDQPGVDVDFTSIPIGPYPNWGASTPTFLFNRIGGGPMQVISLNNQNVLEVDDAGIRILSPTNNGSWFEGLNLHEISLNLAPNGDCLFVRVFDVNGQLVDTRMSTNISESLTFRSQGGPFHRLEVVAKPNELGGILAINGQPRYSDKILDLAHCTNFNAFPTGAVANPLFLPGLTVIASNAVGGLEANPYIEGGPEGNGYHVQYSATLEFVGHCCRRVDIELIQTSGLVDVIPYGASGARLDPQRLDSDSSGEVVTVVLGPFREPICRVDIVAPNDLTRILSICCVPVATNTCVYLPDFLVGTNTNPWTVAGVSFERIGGPGYNSVVSSGGMNVLELGGETLITLSGTCARVLLEVISDGSGGMTLEARSALHEVLDYEGPLTGSPAPQPVVLDGPGIKTIRIKPPPGNGFLVRICCLNE